MSNFLHPVSLQSFLSEYWEKQPLHIERQEFTAEPLLDMPAIETLLSMQPLYFPGVQLTQSGRAIDVATYADEENRVLPLRLFDEHAKGATIVLSQAHKLFPSLAQLCREATRTLQMRAQANVYISPPGNQGFNAHYDTHDVFILQVSGTKTFNFYPSSVELPCPDEQFDASKLKASNIDESVVLHAGDTLYIPRGIVHDAVADDKTPSLHVTLGVYTTIVRDVLQEVIQHICEQDIELRRSVNDSTAWPDIAERLKNELENGHLVSQVLSRMQDDVALDAQQDCMGLAHRRSLASDDNGAAVALKSVRLRPDLIIGHEMDSNARLKVRTFGQVLEFEEPLSALVEQLLVTHRLSESDLAKIDGTQRRALVSCLLQENLIELDWLT